MTTIFMAKRVDCSMRNRCQVSCFISNGTITNKC